MLKGRLRCFHLSLSILNISHSILLSFNMAESDEPLIDLLEGFDHDMETDSPPERRRRPNNGHTSPVAAQKTNGLEADARRCFCLTAVVDVAPLNPDWGTGMEANRAAITNWFIETATIVPDNLGIPRLSGLAMRNEVYFATAPGNAALYVSKKKNGIVRQLPTV